MEDQLTLDKNKQSTNELTKLDFRKRNYDIHASRKTRYYIIIINVNITFIVMLFLLQFYYFMKFLLNILFLFVK